MILLERSTLLPTSLAHYRWSLVDSTPASGRTFARPLSVAETGFYYDRLFNGTGDMVWRYTVELADPAAQRNAMSVGGMFSEQNVGRTWATLKQYYPLLGSRIEARNDLDAPVFVVAERALSEHLPGEMVVGSISTPEEREEILCRLTRDAPTEDHHVIARVLVLACTAESLGTYELVFKLAHSAGDAASGMTLARSFLDVLSSPPMRVPALAERLEMALPWEALNPTLEMSIPRQRWRRAIGKVTFLNMRRRLSGGHAMPRKTADATYCTPSVTHQLHIRFDLAQSRAFVDFARRHSVTLGATMPVISQMALTRVLHRRYLRGEMSEEEWESRRRQPMHYGGPLNLRPHLDKEWQRKGGLSEIALMVDFYDFTLPSMPTPFGTRRDAGVPRADGAPPFAALLSRARFLYRVRETKRQITRTLEHPLFLEIAQAKHLQVYTRRKRIVLAHWQAVAAGEPLPQSPELATLDPAAPDFVYTGGLSSIGNMAAVLPTNYPLPPDHPLSIKRCCTQLSNADTADSPSTAREAPLGIHSSLATREGAIRIVDNGTYLHSSPMDFFLGNGTTRDHFELILSYDANVYRREDAEEYLRECCGALLYYFGDQDVTARGKL
ncbi:hypothetical protein BN946_scf184912.g42 [Trametes cinnabarina]|uniref:Condensation domain-containing protein n=1 Tax=Pycnoporus cinnabarinus TaxID=5643 RepID=A0A060SYB2_PYCCI|nr:hypothetical protein BN946_scf184912.g42 [Trametes cinnabarina]